MLKDICTHIIKTNNDNIYWGEAVNTRDNYYSLVGTGIHVKPDSSFFMTENHVNGNYDGYILHRSKDYRTEHSGVACFRNGKLTGPNMRFVYEKYIEFNTCSNGRMNGFFCHVWYDGSYVITRIDNDVCCGKGLYYKDGYMSFVTLDGNVNIQSYLTKFHVGSELAFTTCRMFMMPFDKNRDVQNVRVAHHRNYVSSIQVIGDEANGYGICRWEDGDRYFGEYIAGSRSGIGCYKFSEGQTLLGKFYNDKISGNAAVWFADGGLTFGNFSGGKKNGVFFELFAGYPYMVQIANFDQNSRIGITYYLNLNDFSVSLYSGDTNLGTQRYR